MPIILDDTYTWESIRRCFASPAVLIIGRDVVHSVKERGSAIVIRTFSVNQQFESDRVIVGIESSNRVLMMNKWRNSVKLLLKI